MGSKYYKAAEGRRIKIINASRVKGTIRRYRRSFLMTDRAETVHSGTATWNSLLFSTVLLHHQTVKNYQYYIIPVLIMLGVEPPPPHRY